MENKWIDRCMMCLEVLMNFLVIFCLETVIFGSFPNLEKVLEAENGQFGAPGLFRQLLLMAVPFLFLLIRAKAAHFMSFVALHGAVAAGAVLLLGQGMAQRVCFGVFVSIYLMLSFMLRISKQRIGEGQLGAVAAGIGAGASFLICAYMGMEAGCGRIINTALLYTFLFFVYSYLEHLDRFVQFNRSSNAHIPVKKMLVRGGTMAGLFGLFTVIILGAGTNNRLVQGMMDLVKKLGYYIARAIAIAVSFLLQLFSGKEQEPVTEIVQQQQMDMGIGEAAAQPAWLELLIKITEYLMAAAVAALLCFLVYKLVLAAIRRFYEKGNAVEVEEGRTTEIRESLERDKRKRDREKALPLLARSPEEKIRKIFVKTVKKLGLLPAPETGRRGRGSWKKEEESMTDGRIHTRTAREILEAGCFTETENLKAAQELLGLYEKARYCGGCTKEEAARAGQAADRITEKKKMA